MSKSLLSIVSICLFAVPRIGEAAFISLVPDPPFAVDFSVSSDMDSTVESTSVDSEPPQLPRLPAGLVIGLSHSAGLVIEVSTGGSNSSLTSTILMDRLPIQPPLLAWRLGEVSPVFPDPDLEGVSPVPRSKSLLHG